MKFWQRHSVTWLRWCEWKEHPSIITSMSQPCTHSTGRLGNCVQLSKNILICNWKIWVFLLLHLARLCIHLPWLGRTCTHLGHNQSWTSRHKIITIWPTNPVSSSWVTNRCFSKEALKCFFFCDLHVLTRKLASPFGHPM